MNNLFTTGLGLTIRLVVDATTSHRRLGASVIGLSEGIILYHSRPGTPSFDASYNPYTAYVLRIILDLLYTQSFVRMAIVILWTCLGVVLADILEFVSDDGRHSRKSRPATHKEKSRKSKGIEPVVERRRQPRVPKLAELPGPTRPSALPKLTRADAFLPDPAISMWPGRRGDVDPVSHSPEFTPSQPLVPEEVSGQQELEEVEDDLLDFSPAEPIPGPTELLDFVPITKSPSLEGITEPVEIVENLDGTAENQTVEPGDGQETAEAPPSDEVPAALVPGQHDAPSLIDEPVPFGSDVAEPIPPASVSGLPLTLASEQSPEPVNENVGEHEDQANVETESDEAPPAEPENAIPLPILTTTTDLVDTDTPSSAVAPDSLNTPLSPPPKNKYALIMEARSYRAKAVQAEKERDRLETERKRAIQEGRSRDGILKEGERDEIAAKALKYHEKAAERFHLADNIDLPPGTIDVHRSPLPQALRLVKERYRLMLKNGEPQLRVIVPTSATSDLRKFLMNELKINHIPYFVDPFRKSFILTIPR